MLLQFKVSTLILALFPAIFLSCNDSQTAEISRKDGYSVELKTPEDSLYHQVMHDHDLAMARVGRLSRYIDQTQKKIDSISKLSLAAQRRLQLYKNELERLNRNLRKAHENMYIWMDEFILDSAIETNVNRRAYLLSEKPKVEKVKNDILSALSRADSLLTTPKENN